VRPFAGASPCPNCHLADSCTRGPFPSGLAKDTLTALTHLQDALDLDSGMKMKRTPACGFSLVELLVVVAIILIIAAIAIPSLLRSKIAANEASAIGSLRTMNTSFVDYASTYAVGYPANLTDMGPSTSPSSTAADLLDSVLVTGTKSGYAFSYTPGTAGPNGVISTYSVTATPLTPGVSGQRGFYTDQSLVIHANPSGIASSADPPI
jgi:type IV pilus assembly protein PilA